VDNGVSTGRLAAEVIAHLARLVGSSDRVTLEIEAGAPEQVVRAVTENSRTLKFTSHGFEQEWRRRSVTGHRAGSRLSPFAAKPSRYARQRFSCSTPS
jgi:hypothetical protein